MIRSMIPRLLTVFLLIPSTAMGQRLPEQVESLRGIETFHVLVDVGGDCLSENEMQSLEASLLLRLQVSLRREGIGIAQGPQMIPLLSFHMYALRHPTELCGFAKNLTLSEVVPLRGRRAVVITWQTNSVALVGERRFRDGALSSLDESILEFLNDYLTANPKG